MSGHGVFEKEIPGGRTGEARHVPTGIAHVSECLIARFYELTVGETSKLHLATRMVTSSLKLSPQNSAAAR